MIQLIPLILQLVGNTKQAPVVTGMSRARNSRWGMLLYVHEAGTDQMYGVKTK